MADILVLPWLLREHDQYLLVIISQVRDWAQMFSFHAFQNKSLCRIIQTMNEVFSFLTKPNKLQYYIVGV